MLKKFIRNFWKELPFYYLILGIISVSSFIITELKEPKLMYGILFPLFWVIVYIVLSKFVI